MKFFSLAIVSLIAAVTVSANSNNKCSSSQFSHSSSRTGDCCLPQGGNKNPPSPPSHKSCPSSGWQWHNGFECCVPTAPNPPSNPSCPSGTWDKGNQCCNKPTPPNPPTPSGGTHHNYKRSGAGASKLASRNWRSKVLNCPTGETVCNVSAGFTKRNTFTCVNTLKDVNFCGGCGLKAGDGQDCSAIPNAWNAVCDMGECQVLTCEDGFRVSHNGRKCIAMD